MALSESQARANKAYRQRNKGKQKAVNIVLPADELEKDKRYPQGFKGKRVQFE